MGDRARHRVSKRRAVPSGNVRWPAALWIGLREALRRRSAMREEGVGWRRGAAMEVVGGEGLVGATGIEPVTLPCEGRGANDINGLSQAHRSSDLILFYFDAPCVLPFGSIEPGALPLKV